MNNFWAEYIELEKLKQKVSWDDLEAVTIIDMEDFPSPYMDIEYWALNPPLSWRKLFYFEYLNTIFYNMARINLITGYIKSNA